MTITKRIATGAAAAVSALCVAFVATNEGTVYKTYPDQGGVITVCEGHTDPTLKLGMKFTRAQCDAFLKADLALAAAAVDATPVTLNDCQRTALVDFTFNLGTKAYNTSTLRRKLASGDYLGASAEFPKWDVVAGQHNPGVHNRRLREQALYNAKPCPAGGPQMAALAGKLGIPLGMYPGLSQTPSTARKTG